MASIETSPWPLVFRVGQGVALPAPANPGAGRTVIRTVTRALEGMQKEAIVHDPFCDSAWRMVCDEGPWLNGTDLSSFPLGFFSAGMVATLASEIIALARREQIVIEDLRITQHARYTMEGSAVRRDMAGSALPLETEVWLTGSAAPARLQALACDALAASPADAVMRRSLASRFRLALNGSETALPGVASSAVPAVADPAPLFEQAKPGRSSFAPGIICKKNAPQPAGETASTPAVGLAAEQKRMVEVRAVLELREDGLKAIEVQCIQPAGSAFEFLSDDPVVFGGAGRAPTGLQYLSAGVAFCFMTQLGRFAAIVKQDLESYGIVQDTVFGLPGGSAGLTTAAEAFPVDTQVFITSADDPAASQLLVRMGEQTCYLHAGYRGVNKTRLRFAAAGDTAGR